MTVAKAQAEIVTDTGFKGIDALRERFGFRESSVLAGIPAGLSETDGTSLAVIAEANEFGTLDGHIPERPAFRTAVSENTEKFSRLNERNLREIANGRMDVDRALGQLGAFAAGRIQDEMAHGDFEPNAPATVERKGSSHPWIDTGLTRQSITWKIEGERGGEGGGGGGE